MDIEQPQRQENTSGNSPDTPETTAAPEQNPPVEAPVSDQDKQDIAERVKELQDKASKKEDSESGGGGGGGDDDGESEQKGEEPDSDAKPVYAEHGHTHNNESPVKKDLKRIRGVVFLMFSWLFGGIKKSWADEKGAKGGGGGGAKKPAGGGGGGGHH